MKDNDATFSLTDQLKKVGIAIAFTALIPVILTATTGIDVFAGCVKYTEDNAPDVGVVGECRPTPDDAGFLQEIFSYLEGDLPYGMLLYLLAMGIAIILGPGKSVIKYQLN